MKFDEMGSKSGQKGGFLRQSAALTKFTATILLIVEAIFTQELVPTVAESSLTPVLRPELSAGHCLLRRQAGSSNLLKTLPPRRSQRGGEVAQPQLTGLLRRSQQPHVEALLTAAAALGLMFQSLHAAAPSLVVVVAVNPCQAETLGMAFALLLADVVLLAGPDVGIKIEDSGAHAVLQHPLHDGTGTGGTAGVEQHLGAAPFGQDDGRSLHTFAENETAKLHIFREISSAVLFFSKTLVRPIQIYVSIRLPLY